MAVNTVRTIFARYVGREILLSVSFVCTAFIALFAFFDLIAEVGDIGKGNYSLAWAVLYVLLLLPAHVYEVSPIAVLIGTLYTLALFAARSEMVVMRTSGVSPPIVWGLLLGPGIVLATLTFLIGEFISPNLEMVARELKLRSTNSVIAREFRSGLWLKSASQFVNVRLVGESGILEKVRFFDFDADRKLRSISEAAYARYIDKEKWQLTDVVRTRIRSSIVETESLSGEIWTSEVTPDMLSILLVLPERMSVWGLYRYIRHLSQTQQSAKRYEIAFWRKLLYPIACLVMMALAVPISYVHVRTGGVGTRVFVGIMVGIIFHVLSSLSSHIGLLNHWSPFTAASVPSLLFLSIAIAGTWSTERH